MPSLQAPLSSRLGDQQTEAQRSQRPALCHRSRSAQRLSQPPPRAPERVACSGLAEGCGRTRRLRDPAQPRRGTPLPPQSSAQGKSHGPGHFLDAAGAAPASQGPHVPASLSVCSHSEWCGGSVLCVLHLCVSESRGSVCVSGCHWCVCSCVQDFACVHVSPYVYIFQHPPARPHPLPALASPGPQCSVLVVRHRCAGNGTVQASLCPGWLQAGALPEGTLLCGHSGPALEFRQGGPRVSA